MTIAEFILTYETCVGWVDKEGTYYKDSEIGSLGLAVICEEGHTLDEAIAFVKSKGWAEGDCSLDLAIACHYPTSVSLAFDEYLYSQGWARIDAVGVTHNYPLTDGQRQFINQFGRDARRIGYIISQLGRRLYWVTE